MRPREVTIEKKVSVAAVATGWLSYKWVSPNNRGVPDRIFIKNGRVVFVEFKAKGKKPTPLQLHIHTKLIDQGMEVYVIDNIEDGLDVLGVAA